MTPLEYALETKEFDIISLLVNKGAVFALTSQRSQKLAFKAALKEDNEQIASGSPGKFSGARGSRRPLHRAACRQWMAACDFCASR